MARVFGVAPVVTDAEPSSPIVLARLLTAGIAEEGARQQLAEEVVLVDGEPITNPTIQRPYPARIVIAG
jgi:hypothetical protein